MAKPIGTSAAVDTPSAAGGRRDLARAQPLASAEPIGAGVRMELLVFLTLRRAAGGGVTKSGDHYLEWGCLTPNWLAGVFEQLTRTGLFARAEEDPAGLQRVSLTPAGQLRYQHLDTLPRRVPTPATALPRSTTSLGSG
jgi:hypothetical protein